MSRALLTIFVILPLFALPGMVCAHATAMDGSATKAHAMPCADRAITGAAQGGTIPDAHMNDGSCCGLASCAPLTLGAATVLSPPLPAQVRFMPANVVPPASPTLPVFAPPG